MKGSDGDGLVFVIDDDEFVRQSIESLIRSARLRVKAFASAEEFLRSKRPDTPACIILDVRLPGMSGLDLQRQMAQSGIEIPIIFITGHGDIRMGVHAMKTGAVEFLTKPFSDLELIRAVQGGIQQNREVRQRLSGCSESNDLGHPSIQEELNRLAGELHDGLAQHLSAIYMQLEVAKKALSSTGADPPCNIDRAIELANLGLVEARRYAHNPSSRAVDELGLREALQHLAEDWTIDGQLRCNFHCDDLPENRLPSRVKHQLLRIAQEAIHNAVRHANPTLIAVTLRWNAPKLILQVRDNGRGISANRLEKCEGFGLRNMRRRIQDIGGKLEIQTATNRGTSIDVTLTI